MVDFEGKKEKRSMSFNLCMVILIAEKSKTAGTAVIAESVDT